ncbi:unnamed protein product [Ceratitis capitata]|uniref:(Mediterranean fruit fly) hypothetical protein n=1 Tax=Ceratitis capitata TaxID=7213 RepID=A0A811UI86_CERCA|nr:unnamed protein product [Ceratitis capitata]
MRLKHLTKHFATLIEISPKTCIPRANKSGKGFQKKLVDNKYFQYLLHAQLNFSPLENIAVCFCALKIIFRNGTVISGVKHKKLRKSHAQIDHTVSPYGFFEIDKL